MALISCKLCGNRISTRAQLCPKCGCPNIVRVAQEPVVPKTKNCAECEYGGSDGGYTCNLCDAETVKPLQQAAQPTHAPSTQPQAPGEGSPAPLALLVQIEELEIDSSLKGVFAKLATSSPASVMLGVRRYASDEPELRYFGSLNTANRISSNLALLLGPYYYLIHGVWRKGGLLMALQLLLIAGIVFCITPVQVAALLGLLAIQLLAYCSAKYDRYRKLMLDETFWW